MEQNNKPVKQEPVSEHDLHDVRCECCGYMTHHREHMGCIRAAYAAPVSAEAIRAETLEEAAKVCEKAMIQMNYSEAPYKQCAAAIRARGEK